MVQLEMQLPAKNSEVKTAMSNQNAYFTYFKEIQSIRGLMSIIEYDKMQGREIISLLQYLSNVLADRISLTSISSDNADNNDNSNNERIVTIKGTIIPPSSDTRIILNNLLYLLRNADHVTDTQLDQSLDLAGGALGFIIKVTL